MTVPAMVNPALTTRMSRAYKLFAGEQFQFNFCICTIVSQVFVQYIFLISCIVNQR